MHVAQEPLTLYRTGVQSYPRRVSVGAGVHSNQSEGTLEPTESHRSIGTVRRYTSLRKHFVLINSCYINRCE